MYEPYMFCLQLQLHLTFCYKIHTLKLFYKTQNNPFPIKIPKIFYCTFMRNVHDVTHLFRNTKKCTKLKKSITKIYHSTNTNYKTN